MPRIDKLTEIESRLVIARSKNMKRIGSVISNTAVWSYGCECNRKQGKRKDWRKQVLEVWYLRVKGISLSTKNVAPYSVSETK